MLCLSFFIGAHRFALPAREIDAVVPWVDLRPVPRAPDWIAGLMRYRGTPVPVLDLGLLALASPCPQLLSTRIILVRVPATQDRIGLRVERATDTLVLPAEHLHQPAVDLPEAPFLGRVAQHDGALIQLVEPAGLLSEPVLALLRPAAHPAPGADATSMEGST